MAKMHVKQGQYFFSAFAQRWPEYWNNFWPSMAEVEPTGLEPPSRARALRKKLKLVRYRNFADQRSLASGFLDTPRPGAVSALTGWATPHTVSAEFSLGEWCNG